MTNTELLVLVFVVGHFAVGFVLGVIVCVQRYNKHQGTSEGDLNMCEMYMEKDAMPDFLSFVLIGYLGLIGVAGMTLIETIVKRNE